jgi:hypothetical protein
MRFPLLLLATTTAALAAAPATATPPGYTACSGQAMGGFYRVLEVKNTTCAEGRIVMKSRAKHDFDKGGDATPLGYVCKTYAVRQPGDPNGGLQYNCAKGTKKVRFFAHP